MLIVINTFMDSTWRGNKLRYRCPENFCAKPLR